jgi:hypothetical protein
MIKIGMNFTDNISMVNQLLQPGQPYRSCSAEFDARINDEGVN